jgi:hypothetical protein
MNCKFCGVFAPLAREKCLPITEIIADLKQMSKITKGKIRCITITGGEPLLHPNIDEIIKETRQSFPTSMIQLYTNGIELLQQPFWDNAGQACKDNDVVIMVTKYPTDLNYEKMDRLAKENQVTLRYQLGFEDNPRAGFFKHLLDINGKQDPHESFKSCYDSIAVPTVAGGKLYACSRIPAVHSFAQKFAPDMEVSENDYLMLNNNLKLVDIQNFLLKPNQFCKYCKPIDMDDLHEWGKSEGKIEEWT